MYTYNIWAKNSISFQNGMLTVHNKSLVVRDLYLHPLVIVHNLFTIANIPQSSFLLWINSTSLWLFVCPNSGDGTEWFLSMDYRRRNWLDPLQCRGITRRRQGDLLDTLGSWEGESSSIWTWPSTFFACLRQVCRSLPWIGGTRIAHTNLLVMFT